MTVIVAFPKIFRGIFWGSGAEERRRFLTVFGGEVGWVSRSEQPFGGGTNLYQKPMPKQDKGVGFFPPPRVLAMSLWVASGVAA